MTEKRQTSQGYIIRILQHFETLEYLTIIRRRRGDYRGA
jgi:hypothetical protein